LAIGLVAWPSFQRAVYPLLVGTQVVPKLAIAPLFLVWFGFGMASKVLVAFLVAFFPIVIDSVIGLRSVDMAKLYVARAAGANELQLFWLVRLPNALPFIFGGMKVSITLAVVGALVGEFVAAESGLGRVLLSANGNMDTELLFATILALVAAGIALALGGLVTGALHLDGLADTVDGLAAARGDRARALEVMRRGDVGPLGAAALVLVLLLVGAEKLFAPGPAEGDRNADGPTTH
jgi:ABC-type nitrate/sulfonate/bicarbonate transport system permease component